MDYLENHLGGIRPHERDIYREHTFRGRLRSQLAGTAEKEKQTLSLLYYPKQLV